MPQPGEGELEVDLEALGNEVDGSNPAPDQAQEDAAAPAAEQQTQETEEAAPEQERTEPVSEISIAGRKYKSQEEANRAHDSLYRHASKLEQELKREREAVKAFSELKKVWRENPDLFNALKKAEADYFAARKGGATPAQAKAQTGTTNVPPEVMKELRELREWREKQDQRFQADDYKAEEKRLTDEFTQLTGKFKLDAPTVDKVRDIMLEYAEKRGVELDAEGAYELLLVRQNRDARSELKRVQSHADTGASSQGSVKAPAKRVDQMDDREFDASLDSWASSQGLS